MRDAVGVERERCEHVEHRRQALLGQDRLVSPLGGAEDARQGLGVGLLETVKDELEAGADVLVQREYVIPQAALGDDEAVVVGQPRELLVTIKELQRLLVLPAPGVADALEEQEREDVG